MADSSNDNFTVLVKTANGSVDDLRVQCEKQWCAFDLKVYLSNHHPSKPPVRSQKLICNGKIVSDESNLSGLGITSLNVILHLVIAPGYLRSSSVPAAMSTAAPRRAESAPQPTTNPVATPSSHETTPNPLTTPSSHETTPTNSSSTNSDQGNTLRFRQPMVDGSSPQQLQYPNGWPNPYMMSPYYAAQMAHWYQVMYNNNNTTGAPTYHQHYVTHPVGVANPPPVAPPQPGGGVEGQQPPQAGAAGVPDNNNNNGGGDGAGDVGAMNAGGGGLVGGLVADNRQQRDLVDYAYMIMMLLFLGTMGYIAGSLYQFIIFGFGVGFILLNQGGWFRLQRRQVAPPPPPPPQRQERQDPPEMNENDGPQEQGQRQDNQQQQEEQQEHQQRGGFFATIGLLITSFFTSLVPQQIPPELEGN